MGVVEVLGGTLILLGLLTRLATLPLIVNMVVAILSTKIPILLGHGFWRFADPSVARSGSWSMMHEARTDLSMLLGCLFLLIVGAGRAPPSRSACTTRSSTSGRTTASRRTSSAVDPETSVGIMRRLPSWRGREPGVPRSRRTRLAGPGASGRWT